MRRSVAKEDTGASKENNKSSHARSRLRQDEEGLYGPVDASLNGPKLWMPDWSEAETGLVRDFNGMKAAWVGQLNMVKASGVSEKLGEGCI